jgi:hypothetical protein
MSLECLQHPAGFAAAAGGGGLQGAAPAAGPVSAHGTSAVGDEVHFGTPSRASTRRYWVWRRQSMSTLGPAPGQAGRSATGPAAVGAICVPSTGRRGWPAAGPPAALPAAPAPRRQGRRCRRGGTGRPSMNEGGTCTTCRCSPAFAADHARRAGGAVACSRDMNSTVISTTERTAVSATGPDTAGPRWSRHLPRDVPPTGVMCSFRSSVRHRRDSDPPAARHRE